MDSDNKFKYTYSAKEQAEIRKIKEKYTDKSSEKNGVSQLERIRKLDNSVTNTATVAAITVGVISALIMGFGMSLVMTDFSAYFGLDYNTALILGIIIGIVGIIGALAAHPLYKLIYNIRRKRVAPEILKLTESLEE